MKISGPLNLAGLEYVADLTALNALADLFEGRIVNMNGTVYIYSGGWIALAAGTASVPPVTGPTANQILRSNGTIAGWDEQYPDDSAAAGKFLRSVSPGVQSWDDPDSALPSQATHAGKYLYTDGTASSWSAILRAGVAAGTANHVLINDGSGNWSSEAALSASRGGLGTNASTFSGYVKGDGAGNFSAGAIAAVDLPTGIDAAKIAGGGVDNTKFGYLSTLTSDVQTQLTARLLKSGGTMTGALTLAADPATALEPATKQYADNLISGLKVKNSVVVAADSNLVLSGEQTVDGVPLVTGDRVLCMGQSTSANRGIYRVELGAWGRTTDADSWAELVSAFCFVESGSYSDCGFVCTVNAGGTLGVTAVTFSQFSGAGTYTAGNGLAITGTTFRVLPDGPTLSVSGTGVKVSDGGIGTTQLAASAVTGAKLGAMTSAELRTAISDETGSGSAVFGTTPTIVTPVIDDYFDVNEESEPTSPAAGKQRVFAGTDGKIYKKNSSGVKTEVGSGSGQGEKTYITNPSAQSAITGWTAVGDLTLVRTSTAAELPREYTTATGIKITATAATTQSVADYVYFDFTLDDVDLNKKLKIQWSQKLVGAYTAGLLAVVITTQADRTTAVATPQTTAIPASDGDFLTSFDSGSTATLSLVIRATADMADSIGLVLSDVVVGPGQIVQGAAVGEWRSFVPTISGAATSSLTGTYKRLTDSARIRIKADLSSISSTITFGIAAIGTPNLSGFPGGLGGYFYDCGHIYDSSAAKIYIVHAYVSGGTIGLFWENGAGVSNTAGPIMTLASPDTINIDLEIPISEWAGSGMNIGAGAQVEYAYNSSTTNTDDTTSFAYGSTGGSLLGSNPAAGGCVKRVRFQNPIQSDDLIVVEVSPLNDGKWFSLPAIDSSQFPLENLHQEGSNFFGLGVYQTAGLASNEIALKFGQYPDSHTTDSAGYNWSSYTAWKYRVRKAKASSPVGFGLAIGGSSGLINYYQEDDTTLAACTFQGNLGGAASAGVAIKITRVGRIVTIDIPVFTGVTPTGGSSALISNTNLPVWARPPIQKTISSMSHNNGLWVQSGMCVIITSGQIQFYRDVNGTAYTNSAAAGFYYTSISYSV
ncbi:MAG TPA: hypothetical protein VE954_43070 [Oligoflexus sp.]|uniref:hypothetical protein n=1 Tax=Oligoflexus sp. TaxID=1971216 RepID=UPI002D5B2B20|nr:hypothetical protein [Oligoflexus sp.]HYX39926.1 hypothetical protein [Oligoflexus sp.]